jgi:hypothetical protein
MMKRFYLIAALALATLTASAQQKLYLSTYQGTDVKKFDGKTCLVNTTRSVYKGWNTLSLPFALSQQELNELFGTDCRLEKLVGVEETDATVQLNFQDCKADGVQANTPYILYYTGENRNVKIVKEALIANAPSSLSFTTQSGDVVTMCGAATKTEGKGLYGVMVINNSDANFVRVGDNTQGFYATRCFMQLASGDSKLLTTRHFALGETTGIKEQLRNGENETMRNDGDVYNTNGIKVANSKDNLKPGLYVVKGQKILVK